MTDKTDLPRRRRALLFLCLFHGGIAAAALLLFALDRVGARFGWNIPCFFKQCFHLYCPGCGGTRALFSLLCGDLAGMLRAYPPLPFFIGGALTGDAVALTIFFCPTARINARRAAHILLFFTLAVLLLHFFVRNLLLLRGIDPLGDFIK